MMTAHILVPSLDEEKPATLSPAIVRGLLREELDFNGVILSDDLEMKAIADAYTVPDAAVQAIAAGCDGVLVCRANVSDRTGDAEAQVAVLRRLSTQSKMESRSSAPRMRWRATAARRSAFSRRQSHRAVMQRCASFLATTSIAALPTRCRVISKCPMLKVSMLKAHRATSFSA